MLGKLTTSWLILICCFHIAFTVVAEVVTEAPEVDCKEVMCTQVVCPDGTIAPAPEGACCGDYSLCQAACPAIQTNVDYPGNDLMAGGMLGRVPGHLTRDECAAWCKADSRCVGYTFIKSESKNDNCAVKASWDEGSKRTGSSCCDSQQITTGCISDSTSRRRRLLSFPYVFGPILGSVLPSIWNSATLPSQKGGMKFLGLGACDSGYYAGWDGKGIGSQEGCNQVCLSEPQCKYAAFKPGQSCSRYNGHTCSLDLQYWDYATYMKVPNWEFLGSGACVNANNQIYRRNVLTAGQYGFSGSKESCKQVCAQHPSCVGINYVNHHVHCHINLGDGVPIPELGWNIHWGIGTGPIHGTIPYGLWECHRMA